MNPTYIINNVRTQWIKYEYLNENLSCTTEHHRFIFMKGFSLPTFIIFYFLLVGVSHNRMHWEGGFQIPDKLWMYIYSEWVPLDETDSFGPADKSQWIETNLNKSLYLFYLFRAVSAARSVVLSRTLKMYFSYWQMFFVRLAIVTISLKPQLHLKYAQFYCSICREICSLQS